ncbi:MAG: DUF2283 domain-containing protein [Candidatus Natronoplasma sp.]
MAIEDMEKYLDLASDVININKNNVWISHDKDADVIYINFKKPSNSDDSELTDDDIIIRYEEGEVVGLTILHASKRKT